VKKVRVSAAARADLDGIWLYIAKEGSERAANRFIDLLTDKFLLLAYLPNLRNVEDEVWKNRIATKDRRGVDVFLRRPGSIDVSVSLERVD